jgi:hypothetical protein
VKDVLSLLELSLEMRLEVILFAGEWSDDVISSLIINKCRGGVRLAAVVVPSFGRSRSLLLGRIANLLLPCSGRVGASGYSSSFLGTVARVEFKADSVVVYSHGVSASLSSSVAFISLIDSSLLSGRDFLGLRILCVVLMLLFLLVFFQVVG